jgi:ribosomal protein S18 acetylase RimI-like enzyme
MNIRELTVSDIPWVESLEAEHFGSPRVVSRGVLQHDARDSPGLIAKVDSRLAGILQYHTEGSQWEVLVLISLIRGQGIGRKLLEAAQDKARQDGCEILWLITTNNNRGAQEFYRAIGWRQAGVHRGAVGEARKSKPEIPELDAQGTPIEDEIECGLRISGG